MKYAEAKKLINSLFKEKLKAYGFKRYKYGFEKNENNIYSRCGISIFDYSDFQKSTFIFSIGIIPLAKILCAIDNEVYNVKNSKPSDYSLSQAGLCDDKIFDAPDFTITDEKDIEYMVETVMEFMDNRGFKMLQDKSSLKNLENYVNNECDVMYRDNALGLILAKILNKDYYHELIYKYGEEVKEWVHESSKKNYYDVEFFLKNHTREELMAIGGIKEEDLF